MRVAGVFAAWLAMAPTASAQAPSPAADPFARRGWHLEFATHVAIETWNYNISHESLFGIEPGLTYGIRDGLVLSVAGPLYFVDQRGIDAFLLGATFGVRGRVFRRGRVSAFLEFEVGISEADTYAPPHGTRFNYLALGGAGATMRVAGAVHLLASLRWIHVSNNSLAGRGRNPDIEAVGPQVGMLIGF